MQTRLQRQEIDEMTCSCGLPDQKACKKLFATVTAKEFSDFRYFRVHRLTVDTYSLQHPEAYMKSGKSYAAHLTGACCAMEYGNAPALLRLLQRWLNGNKHLQKPAPLAHLGELTISHVAAAEDAATHARRVREWAAAAWQAYAVYHDLAKHWIGMAMQEAGRPPGR